MLFDGLVIYTFISGLYCLKRRHFEGTFMREREKKKKEKEIIH